MRRHTLPLSATTDEHAGHPFGKVEPLTMKGTTRYTTRDQYRALAMNPDKNIVSLHDVMRQLA